MAPAEVEMKQEELEKGAQELRSRFMEELKEKPDIREHYCECDVSKVEQDDWYCKRFVLHEKGDIERALEMTRVALKWRKDFGVHDIKESSLYIEFFEAGGVYPSNRDKLGNENLLIIVKLNKRDSEIQGELRRFLIYWIEKLDKRSNGKKINVIFNCTSAGLANLDLEMIRFLINTFKHYYPWLLESIIVFDMPWIFSAAWTLIKSWLPQDDVKRIKFVSRKTVQDLIDLDNLPVSMGGKVQQEFDPSILEEYKRLCRQQIEAARTTNDRKGQGYLRIRPEACLVFEEKEEHGRQLVILHLNNVAGHPIGYRVRSNRIQSYKVRPSVGVIEPGSTKQISVHLLQGFSVSPTDKFLVQAIPVDSAAIALPSFDDLWKKTGRQQRQQTVLLSRAVKKQEIKAVPHDENDFQESPINMEPSPFSEELEQLRRRNSKLKALILVLMILQSMFALAFCRIYADLGSDQRFIAALCRSMAPLSWPFCQPDLQVVH